MPKLLAGQIVFEKGYSIPTTFQNLFPTKYITFGASTYGLAPEVIYQILWADRFDRPTLFIEALNRNEHFERINMIRPAIWAILEILRSMRSFILMGCKGILDSCG